MEQRQSAVKGYAGMSYSIDRQRILKILGLEENELRKLCNGTSSNSDKAAPTHIMPGTPIDVEQIRNSPSIEEHRVIELLNHIQWSLDSIELVVPEGKIDQFFVARCENQRKSIENLKRILALHFDVLRSVENVTRRVLPDSEVTIYATVLDAINTVASILDEKEIDIDIDSLKGESFRHNKKYMAETITRLLGVLAQAAEEQSSIQITMGSEGANRHLDIVCSDTCISVNDWISLMGLVEGKDSWYPGLNKIDNYEETVLTLRLVLIHLARQMMQLEVFAGQDNHCVFRIIADSDV